MKLRAICGCLVVGFVLSCVAQAQQSQPAGNGAAPASDPLVTLLVSKGLLTSEEAGTIAAAGDESHQRDRLASLLKD